MPDELVILRKQFSVNPSRFLPPRRLREIRTSKFKRKYTFPSHQEAVEFTENQAFKRLHGLGDTAYQNRRTNQHLTRYGKDYNLMHNRLIEENVGLAGHISKMFYQTIPDEDERFAQALFTLYRAVQKFDPWRGFKFSTYACNSMILELGRKAQQDARYHSHFPVQLSPDFQDPAITDTPPRSDQTALLIERLPYILGNGILTNKERAIIAEKFLLHPGEKVRFEDTARIFGHTNSRSQQICQSALTKLRSALQDELRRYEPSFS